MSNNLLSLDNVCPCLSKWIILYTIYAQFCFFGQYVYRHLILFSRTFQLYSCVECRLYEIWNLGIFELTIDIFVDRFGLVTQSELKLKLETVFNSFLFCLPAIMIFFSSNIFFILADTIP